MMGILQVQVTLHINSHLLLLQQMEEDFHISQFERVSILHGIHGILFFIRGTSIPMLHLLLDQMLHEIGQSMLQEMLQQFLLSEQTLQIISRSGMVAHSSQVK